MNLPNNVLQWVVKAEADFQTAVTMAQKVAEPVPDIVGFHCQQCIEKYLKALLVKQKIIFPKTHDLLELLELALASDVCLEIYRNALRFLNPFSVQFRYPGENATVEEASQALKVTKELRDYFRKKMV